MIAFWAVFLVSFTTTNEKAITPDGEPHFTKPRNATFRNGPPVGEARRNGSPPLKKARFVPIKRLGDLTKTVGRTSRGRQNPRKKVAMFCSGVHLQRGSNPFYGERVSPARRGARDKNDDERTATEPTAKIFSPSPENFCSSSIFDNFLNTINIITLRTSNCPRTHYISESAHISFNIKSKPTTRTFMKIISSKYNAIRNTASISSMSKIW